MNITFATEADYRYIFERDKHLLESLILPKIYGGRAELRRTLHDMPVIPDLHEVSSQDVEAFIPQVLGDMEYDQGVVLEQLHVFTLEQIIGYIETAVELSVLCIKQAEVMYRC